jgi:NTE family protein
MEEKGSVSYATPLPSKETRWRCQLTEGSKTSQAPPHLSCKIPAVDRLPQKDRRPSRNRLRFGARTALGLLGALVLLSGCTAHYRPNKPLEKWAPSPGSGLAPDQRRNSDLDSVRIVVSFSGGGTRAAAFAFGVLEELAATRIRVGGEERSLLDEVDLVTGVSGGSFTAAYFALRGNAIFDEFPERFLKHNIQGALIARLFIPWNWVKLASRQYGTGDLAAEYYDAHVFDGATFRDLEQSDGPFVDITATDLGAGSPFSFTQEQFDYICSDITDYPIAWATAASSAVPGLLSPVSLTNFSGQCDFEAPEWITEVMHRERGYTRRYMNARALSSYSKKQRRHIRLVDGGVSDNLAIRGPFEAVLSADPRDRERPARLEGVREVILISVNAATIAKPRWEERGIMPNLGDLVGRSSGIYIQRYNVETIEFAKAVLQSWNYVGAGWSPPLRTHLLDLDFLQIEDPEEREFLGSLPTSFKLSDDAVDRLRAAGRQLLRDSPKFPRLLRALSELEG